MFARDKRIGPYTYVYLVENVRENGRTRQRIIANLGRREVVVARGDLDRLARSVARLAQRSMVLSLVEGEAPPHAMCRRIGPALLFERLWQEVGCRSVLEDLAGQRQFAFAVERATFLTVLHRLFVSGSDRAAEKWRADYRIDGTEGLRLHHLYRAMAWLGEPLADQSGASGLAPRCHKDLIEEELFVRRRDLFAELSVVFMDTTSLSFEGQGGEELGRRGHSKDYRPDLNQMIVGLVMDQDGRPLCSELWPGNTADVTTLLPVVDRLRARFGVGRICIVADRGMISAQTIASLEDRKLEYVLGVRERSSAEVRRTVIDDQTPFVPLVVPRASGLTELEAKQVKIGERRYIVCRNLAEARRDAEQRAAILDGLRAKLAQGDKALVGNSGFRRYLKTVSAEHFAIDEARVADDQRFDGLYVLRTNTKITPLQVMLRYRDLLRVEQLLRQAKAVLATRPIYHSSDMAIRGHVFCSFLALLLAKELEDRLHRHAVVAEWGDILRDLDRLQEIELEQDGKRFLLRTPTTGVAGKLFQAVGVALPPNIQELPRPTPQPPA
ncbi:MAG TPA: IS1634 family transposase [Stellaceae bacterium]|nr:IS1634 family transposase [Stellaceae bacterium]